LRSRAATSLPRRVATGPGRDYDRATIAAGIVPRLRITGRIQMTLVPESHRRTPMLVLARTAFIAVILLAAATARAATIGALGDPTAVRTLPHPPANVPGDYVVTPNGYFHPSCVQRVDADEQLRPGAMLVRKDGTRRTVAPCAYPHYAADGTELAPESVPTPGAAASPAGGEINGWVAYGSYVLPRNGAARSIFAEMTVPTAPDVHSGQIIYFFPGLEDIEHVQTIVQPVLGWNAFNDGGWTIASWNCCLAGHTWHSSPVVVPSGTTLEGLVVGGTCTNGVCSNWRIVTRDAVNDRETTLDTDGYGQAFDWVFGAVLEVYGVSQCGHYPASGDETFSGIVVLAPQTPLASTSNVRTLRFPWSPWTIGDGVQCGYTVEPFPDADSPQIRIGY
jgi:hypothetical protein